MTHKKQDRTGIDLDALVRRSGRAAVLRTKGKLIHYKDMPEALRNWVDQSPADAWQKLNQADAGRVQASADQGPNPGSFRSRVLMHKTPVLGEPEDVLKQNRKPTAKPPEKTKVEIDEARSLNPHYEIFVRLALASFRNENWEQACAQIDNHGCGLIALAGITDDTKAAFLRHIRLFVSYTPHLTAALISISGTCKPEELEQLLIDLVTGKRKVTTEHEDTFKGIAINRACYLRAQYNPEVFL